MLLLFVALPLTASAYDFMVDGLCYNIIGDNEVEVTYYSSNTASYDYAIAYPSLYGDLIIPEIVTNEGCDYKVTRIGFYAFKRTSGITTVKLPESITEISDKGFYTCTGLKTINLPNALTSIGQYAFTNNTSLTRVTIPYSVTKIGMAAFYGCTLTSATISRSVSTRQVWGPFSGCTLDTLIIAGKGDFSLYDESGRQTGLGAGQSQMQINSIFIGSEITSLGQLGAKPTIVNCYAKIPPTCMDNTFYSYDGELHVPASSTTAYITADYWQYFSNLVNDLTDKVSLDITSADLIQWETLDLTATVNPSSSELIWSTTNPLVATVDENGVVTALKEGECEIFATLASNYAVYASCHITVSYPEITLSLNNDSIEMNLGEENTLAVDITPDNTGLTPTWTSSDVSVATVENGVVSAVGEGECDITATVLDKSVTCHVTVNGIITITLDQHELELDLNHMAVLTPTCSPAETDLTVTSSDPSVVFARMVTQNGTAKVQLVGMKQGEATITVASVDGKAIPDSCVVTVVRRVGDLNADGYINVMDITTLIELIMGNVDAPDDAEMPYCDVKADGEINVMDITALIDIIMNS